MAIVARFGPHGVQIISARTTARGRNRITIRALSGHPFRTWKGGAWIATPRAIVNLDQLDNIHKDEEVNQ